MRDKENKDITHHTAVDGDPISQVLTNHKRISKIMSKTMDSIGIRTAPRPLHVSKQGLRTSSTCVKRSKLQGLPRIYTSRSDTHRWPPPAVVAWTPPFCVQVS